MAIAYLEWIDQDGSKHRQPVIDKVFIGRGCKGLASDRCILVEEAAVSRDHAVVSWSGSSLEIVDMSRNGTWLNEVRMSPGALVQLKDGDKIRLGGMTIGVCCPQSASQKRAPVQWDESTTITPTQTWVTHVVADVRNFSTLTQAYDSQNAYSLMNEIIRSFSDIVRTFKGTIKDYAGDAVFAFWTHAAMPTAQQAMLACQAALAQANAIRRIHTDIRAETRMPDTIRMGWGIATGQVTISNYGDRSMDLAVVGDATNLAFRLSGLANKSLPAPIIICGRTAELVQERMTVKDLGLVRTKGRAGKEKVFALSG